MSAPRFEVARTDAGFHARFRAGNGRIVWTSEVYARHRTAIRAVDLICDAIGAMFTDDQGIEVREVDERKADPS